MLMLMRRLLVLLSIIVVSLVSVSGGKVFAQEQATETICDSVTTASAITKVPAGTYDLYVKLGSQVAGPETTKLAINSFSSEFGTCDNVGAVSANSDSYALATKGFISDGEVIEVYLNSASTSSNQTAGGPQVVFVPSDTQICDFVSGCVVEFSGQKMELTPRKISLTSDSLKVGLLKMGSGDIKTAIYSVDSKPAYELRDLKPFNESYVPGGEHTLTRRVVFKDGVSLSDTRVIKRGSVANATYIFQATLARHSRSIMIIASFILVFLIWITVSWFLRRRARRKLWHQTHVASSEHPAFDATKVGAQKVFHEETVFETLWRWKALLIGMLAFSTLLLAANSYVISFFTVDGVSMYPTLEDRSTHAIVKLPQTLSHINNSEFVPGRGDVVVLHKDENNLFETDEEQAKTYVVKRVLGLPGERVVVKNGVLTIYNKEYKDGFVPDERYKWVSDLSGSEDFLIDITLKDSEIFVAGDNRDESIDSRFYGPVNTSEVVGKVRI